MKVKKLSVMALAALLALSVCGCEQAPEREVLRVEYEDDLQRNELLKEENAFARDDTAVAAGCRFSD